MEKDLISIIIPVYNVEKYVDQCIKSVLTQTYSNLEIIIIDDASKDNSYIKCEYWKAQDVRINLYKNDVQIGPGKARNFGLEKAKGKYIIFLDSDDWMANEFIEKMYNELIKTNSDFIASNEEFIVVDEKIKYIRHDIPEGVYETLKEKELVLLAGSTAIWGKIYNKNWLLNNKMRQPETYWAEDYGAFPVLVMKAKKIGILGDAGMYYRKLRNGSLTSGYDGTKLYEGYRQAVLFMSLNTPNEYIKAITAYCLRGFYSNYYQAVQNKDEKTKSLLENIIKGLLWRTIKNEFEVKEKNYFIIGSFSLRWELQKAGVMIKNIAHYCFSSIIAMMSPCFNIDIEHDSLFRKNQIKQDVNSTLLYDITEQSVDTIVVIDFLEERYDIIEIGKDKYITCSEAFAECKWILEQDFHIIESGTQKHIELWKEKCAEFIRLLKKYYKPSQVILVRNRMTLKYGNMYYQEDFKSQDKIIKINKMITKMENYFIEHFSGIAVIDYTENTFFDFTDSKFQWGCKPEYSNNALYAEIGMKIFEKMYIENGNKEKDNG